MTNYQTKISAFIVVKSGNFCLRVCHPSLFDWNFFKIGSVSVKDIRKNAPILQVGGSSHILSTPPVAAVRGTFGYDDRDFLAPQPFEFLAYLQLMSCQKSLQGK